MVEAIRGEPAPRYVVKEVDLATQVVRVTPDETRPDRPRVGLPDFSHEATYTWVVGTARSILGTDPQFAPHFEVIPPTYEEFMKTTAGQHFAGNIPRSTVNEDPKGKAILVALARGTLFLVGDQPSGMRLFVTYDERTDEAVGFLAIVEYGTVREASERSKNPYPMRRLLESLRNPDDEYWTALAEKQIMERPSQEQLDGIRERIADLPIIVPCMIFTNPNFRRQGAASSLVRKVYRDLAVVGSTNEATTLMMRRNALPESVTVFAPGFALENDFPERDVFLALQLVMIIRYREVYENLVNSKSDAAPLYKAFADIQKVVDVFILDLEGTHVDPDEQKKILEDAVRNGKATERELMLLTVPDILRTQYSIISIPQKTLP